MASIDKRSVSPEVLSIITAASDGLTQAVKRRRLSSVEAKIFDAKNSFVLVLSSGFNCMVRFAPDRSSFQLAVNYGLFHFYREMTRMLFSRIAVVSASQYGSGQHGNVDAPFDKTAEAAKELMSGFWQAKIRKPRELTLEEGSQLLFNLFLKLGLRFSIAHEFGHVMLEVSEEGRKYKAAGERVVTDFLSQAPDTSISPEARKRMVNDWGAEFAADILGLELAAQCEPEDSFKWFQLYASEWFFTMCDMLWRFYSKKHGPLTLTTHPAPFMRLDILRNHTNASARPQDFTEGLKPLIKAILEAV
jgi:hypothetical protein